MSAFQLFYHLNTQHVRYSDPDINLICWRYLELIFYPKIPKSSSSLDSVETEAKEQLFPMKLSSKSDLGTTLAPPCIDLPWMLAPETA